MGSVFGCHTDSSIKIYNTMFYQPDYYDFRPVLSQIIQTHNGKPLVGISPIGRELMFSEYILGQYLTLISQRKIWCD